MKSIVLSIFFVTSLGCTKRSPEEIQNSAYAYILNEIHEVVLLKKFTDKEELKIRLGNLNQGGSLEGFYNSLTHSSDYRALEEKSKNSNEAALEQFIQSMIRIQKQLPEPSSFSSHHGDPLALPMMPEESTNNEKSIGAGVTELTFSGSGKEKGFSSNNPTLLKEKFQKIFSDSSIYTLKRVLGDELLKLIESIKKNRSNLSNWYGKWAVETLQHKIDFGVPLRNKSDVQFHKDWAEKVDLDTFRWEALNRAHRILNHYAKLKVGTE